MSLVTLILFLLSLAAAGYALIAGIDRRQRIDEPERLALCLPAGIAAVSAVLFTLNVVGIPFGRPLVLPILAVSLASGAVVAASRREHRRHLQARWREHPFQPGMVGTIALVVSCLIVVSLLIQGLLSHGLLTDTENQHLPYAAIVFRTGHQPAFSSLSGGETFCMSPCLFELYAAEWCCLGKIDPVFPGLLPAILMLPWAALTLLVTRRVIRCPDRAAGVAILLFTASYDLKMILGGENCDFLRVLLDGGAAYVLARDLAGPRLPDGRPPGALPRLPLAAVLVALDCWTKYHGLPFAGCIVGALGLLLWRTGRAGLRSLGMFLAVVTGLLLPLLLRNALVFGNPVYPVGARWLGGVFSTPWSVRVVVAQWQPAHPFYDFPGMVWHLLREPALVLGLPALLLVRRRRRPLLFLGLLSGLYLLAFAAVMHNEGGGIRFAAAAPGILSWLGAGLVEEIGAGNRRAAGVLFAWCAAVGLILAAEGLQSQPALLLPDGLVNLLVRAWWVLPFGAGVGVCALGLPRSGFRVAFVYWPVLAVAAVALRVNPPCLDLPDLASVLRSDAVSRVDSASASIGQMQETAPPTIVTYTAFSRRWVVPGALLQPDNPLFERAQQPGAAQDSVLASLARAGVTDLLDWKPRSGNVNTIYREDRVVQALQRGRRLRLVQDDPLSARYQVLYDAGQQPCRPTPSHPMPWLFEFAASAPMR